MRPLSTTTLETVVTWLQSFGAAKLTRIDLRRDVGTGRVQCWTSPGPEYRTIAEPIFKAAEQDAQMRPTPYVMYTARAFEAGSDEEGLASLAMRLPGSAGGIGDDLAFEGNDLAAAFMFALKQNKSLVELLVSSRETTEAHLLRQVDRLQAEVDKAYEHRIQGIRLYEDLLSQKNEREVRRDELALKESGQKYWIEKAEYFAPVVLNRLLQGGPGKGAPGLEAMLNALFANMNPETLKLLIGPNGPLTDEERLVVGEIYMSLANKDAARKKGRRPLNSSSSAAHDPPPPPAAETKE
jgi:hypothetical protein